MEAGSPGAPKAFQKFVNDTRTTHFANARVFATPGLHPSVRSPAAGRVSYGCAFKHPLPAGRTSEIDAIGAATSVAAPAAEKTIQGSIRQCLARSTATTGPHSSQRKESAFSGAWIFESPQRCLTPAAAFCWAGLQRGPIAAHHPARILVAASRQRRAVGADA